MSKLVSGWYLIFWILLPLGMVLSCTQDTSVAPKGDKLLAQVHNKTLYLSELEGMVPEGNSSEDSSLIINAFVERWLREAVLLHEAELNLPKDLNIDKLVRDYRASLIKHHYEQILVNQLLDSTVTTSELQEFYEKNKDQFQLEEPILRCYFVKVPKVAPDQNEFRKRWNNLDKPGNLDAVKTYVDTYATTSKLSPTDWYQADDIVAEMPAGQLNAASISTNTSFIQNDATYSYYFKVLEMIPARSIPPFSFVEDKAKRVILHQRKQKLLDQKKEDMYERELRQNNIKVF